MNRLAVLLCAVSLALAALPGPGAFAQTAPPPAAAPAPTPNLRSFQSFIPEADIVEKQWYGLEFRYQNGAVPPVESADGYLLTPTIALSPLKNLEVGGTFSWIDYSMNNDIEVSPGDTFSGDSGIGDITVWGKYRFLDGPVAAAAGLFVTLPTGSEDKGLGTGEVDWAIFGGTRVKAGSGYFDGNVTMRFNHDATVLNQELDGKTSISLAAGYMWQPYKDWAFSGELTADSERYAGASSDFRVTAGAQFLGLKHSRLRGAASLGLTDGAPNFEVILGYAFAF